MRKRKTMAASHDGQTKEELQTFIATVANRKSKAI
jgi:hypothetical protein